MSRVPYSRLLPLALAVVLLPAWPAAAQPVAEADRIPVDVRRTTLLVRDMDRALAFWRDALGLRVVYDQVIGQPPDTIHLVLLRANDQFIGNIGLMRRASDPAGVPVKYERATTGQPIIVVNAKDLETRIEKIKAVPGVRIQSGPQRIDYPSPDGKGTIPVLATFLWDPDGFFVEVKKTRGPPAGMEARCSGRLWSYCQGGGTRGAAHRR